MISADAGLKVQSKSKKEAMARSMRKARWHDLVRTIVVEPHLE